MATRCPAGFDPNRLRHEVSEAYGAVAEDPDGDYHFHHGPQYAVSALGCSAEAVARLHTMSTFAMAMRSR